ncbi:MAG: hypothetical protein P1U89_22080 [Verrucomicrobiales bacterium]|nr:hypothetical protein [Verrucomicrobiales bacterium]
MVHSELFSSVKAAFDREGWAFTEVEGREVLTCGFEAHHTRVNLHVQTFQQMRAVSVVSESALRTSNPLQRDRLAELVMRVNHTLTVGAFELQWDIGQIIFRITNLFPTPQGDIDIIAGLVHNVVAEMDRISPMETLLHRAEGPELAGIDILELINREDLLPEVPVPQGE